MQGAEFEQVYDFGNLYAGFLKARRGKRHKPSVAKFEANLLEALCLLSEMLKTKTYRPSDYFVFKVYEPKERIVMTNAFKDKVVQPPYATTYLNPRFQKPLSGTTTHRRAGAEHMTGYTALKNSCGPTTSHARRTPSGSGGPRDCRRPAGGSAALFGRLGFEMRHIEVFLFNPA